MSEFDYGNARLKGMRSRLLSREALYALAGTGSVAGLLGALNQTPYRPAVEATLVRLQGLPGLMAALRSDLAAAFARLGTFYNGQAAGLVQLLLRQQTVDNVKAILRGLGQQLAADVIMNAVWPAGELDLTQLQTMAGAADPRAAIDLLATWQSPLAAPLLAARLTTPNASIRELEQALERWYIECLAAAAPKSRLWATHVRQRVDTANIMVALRLVGLAGEPPPLAATFLPTACGSLNLSQLEGLTREPDVAAAVARLPTAPYGQLLAAALPADGSAPRLSDLERRLDEVCLKTAVLGLQIDPLGIGVPLGYIALKLNEVTNLRLIGQALYLKIPARRIVEQLLFVS